jgi:hypothetical protein
MPKTLDALLSRAASAISRREQVAYDVADENCQILGNVAHMRWFRYAVATELTQRHKSWEHLFEEIKKSP